MESIKDQAYDDYNIFIVNDGSTDTSLNVVKNWLKDNVDIKARTNIQNQVNQGALLYKEFTFKFSQ